MGSGETEEFYLLKIKSDLISTIVNFHIVSIHIDLLVSIVEDCCWKGRRQRGIKGGKERKR